MKSSQSAAEPTAERKIITRRSAAAATIPAGRAVPSCFRQYQSGGESQNGTVRHEYDGAATFQCVGASISISVVGSDARPVGELRSGNG